MSLAERLTDFARTLSVVPIGPTHLDPGDVATAGIQPSIANLEIPEILTSELEVTWLTKQVRWREHLPEAVPLDPATLGERMLGPLPIAAPGGGALPAGGSGPAGTAGVLGQISANLKIPTSVRIPVSATVSWEVWREMGEGEEPRQVGGYVAGSDELREEGVLATSGWLVPEVTLLLRPELYELSRSRTVPASVWSLKARVKLAATAPALPGDAGGGGTVESEEVVLGPVPLHVAALGIPKLLALFRNTNFSPTSEAGVASRSESWAFIVVPSDSPVREVAQLLDTLRSVDEALRPLRAFADLAVFLTGFGVLTGAIPRQTFVHLEAADYINNLGTLLISAGDVFAGGNLRPEDHASSLILLAMPGGTVELSSDQQAEGRWITTNGSFTVSTGPEMFAVMGSFEPRSDRSVRLTSDLLDTLVSPPNATAHVIAPPEGRRDAWGINTFDNEISSLRFR